ncbi:Cmx/CmrA family chloramphenicol efflux MFS transporter [Amycolatopsis taiwanensis]|uniref:Cmx/CmrA family chloramphenicol efflux MFS transporter n=1 Tax=Amycolatopsis taiwanensis TaxID=342230 RepID=UPI000484055E|nr:Cmx/CmrA family chloramphenicol efflux MFS transporter [Amycolatopsis taiwanensis]
MPLTVYVLGLSIFALGTSEFMLSGLLPPIAADLGVSIPDAGLLISAYAFGMLFGAPLLAIATHRLPRKTTLLGTLAVFAASHAVSALAPSYGLLFGSRVIAAVANAGFWAAAAATTLAVVPAGRRGRAMAIVTGGLTVATVLGVPAGTFLGQHAGWRAAFWAVGALSALAFVAVVTLVPAVPGSSERAGLRTELSAYRSPRLWLALAIIAIITAASTVVFAYLSPLLTRSIGLPEEWVPAVLALYGVGALIGITTGGRFADRHAIGTIASGALLALAALAVLATAPSIPVAVVAAILLGFGGFAVNPALNTRVFALAEAAPSLAGASTTSAFNVGIVTAPWAGGLAIDAGLGYLSVTWLGIGFAVLALGATAWAALLERRPVPALATV